MNSNSIFNLGQYVRDVFDLNKDGRVTFKEFFATLIPNYAIAIAFADLSRSYDVDRIVNWVIWLSGGYIVALLIYIVIDKNIRLMRAKVKAREQANFQGELNKSMRTILADLREGLKEEADLRREFGDLAVDSHLQMMRGMANKDNSQFKPPARLEVPRDNNHHSLQMPNMQAGNPTQPPRQE